MRPFSKKIKIILLTTLFLFLILLIFNSPPFSNKIKNFFYLIFQPLYKFSWKIGERIAFFIDTIKNCKNLKKENQNLKLKINQLINELANLVEIKKENETLREALKLGKELEFELVLVEPILQETPDTLIINKGLKDGLKKNLPVITQEKVLVGKIDEVFDNFSRVKLISTKNFSFNVKIIQNNIDCLARGEGNLKISLDLIPKDKEIKTGDFVVTSNLGGIFPEGLFIGEIESIKKTDLDPFQKAQIKLAFQIDYLNFFFVIKNFESI
jgi:rod shape-determining protein MreC